MPNPIPPKQGRPVGYRKPNPRRHRASLRLNDAELAAWHYLGPERIRQLIEMDYRADRPEHD